MKKIGFYLLSVVILFCFTRYAHASNFLSQTRDEVGVTTYNFIQNLYAVPSGNTALVTHIKLKLQYNGGCPDGVYGAISFNNDSFFSDPVYLADAVTTQEMDFPVTSGNLQASQVQNFKLIVFSRGRQCDNGDFLTFRAAVRLDDNSYNTAAPDKILWFEIFDANVDAVPPVKNPVLIVPGVLGTEFSDGQSLIWLDIHKLVSSDDKFLDQLSFSSQILPLSTSLSSTEVIRQIDPLGNFKKFDYTQGLIDELTKQGYSVNADAVQRLYLFAYDWRYGVTTPDASGKNNTQKLAEKIQSILQETHAQKVDIVAHSTGGLLVKKYVMDNPTTHSIDKAVFVGVPELGAPKATKVLFQGDDFDIPGLDPLEMKKISRNMPVVYDLAPSQSYFNVKGSWVKNITVFDRKATTQDLGYAEVRSMLHTDGVLNDTAWNNANNLHTTAFDYFDMRTVGVNVFNIVGCKSSTPGTVVRTGTDQLTGFKVEYGPTELTTGDSTVPFESANATLVDNAQTFYLPKADHSTMFTSDGSRQEIVNILSGSALSTGRIITKNDLLQNHSLCELKGKRIIFHSPVNVEATDASGNYIGMLPDGTVTNTIPGASLEVVNGHKYLYLPQGDGEQYNVHFIGTDTGTYTLQVEDIDDSKVVKTTSFIDQPVTTKVQGSIDITTNVAVHEDINGDGIFETDLIPSGVVSVDSVGDILPPQTSLNLIGVQGAPGFYRSAVSVALTASDIAQPGVTPSGVQKVEYTIDGGQRQLYTGPFSVSTEGAHVVSYFATDVIGNRELVGTITFTIDTTAPEVSFSWSTVQKDLQFTGIDAVTPKPTVVDANGAVTITDEAGNSTILTFAQANRKTALHADLVGIKYNGVPADAKKIKLAYNWLLNAKGDLAGLVQQVYSKNGFYVLATYDGKNTTVLALDKSGLRTTKTTGLRLLMVTTNKGDISWQ